MNNPVNPTIANLLKGKKFYDSTSNLYINEELIYAEGRMCDWNREPDYEEMEDPTSAPTIAQTISWFYKKHNLWIEAAYGFHPNGFYWLITNTVTKKSYNSETNAFQPSTITPEEAYENAFKYAIEKLIP